MRLSILDKRIDETRAAKAKAAALLNKLDQPRIELERLAQLEAELTAAKLQAEQEAAQLAAERADAVQTLARLDTMQADYDAANRWIGRMQAMCEGGYFGLATNVNKVLGYGRLAVELQAATHAKLVDIDKRLKELDQ